MSEATIIIVGAGQAGGRAAGALRAGGHDGRIVILGDEPDAPYERPPLSKEVLTQDQDPLKASLFEPEWYAENRVELQVGERVTQIDVADSRVLTESGNTWSYDQLILATGTRARSLPGVAVDHETVFMLRSAEDARRLRPSLREGQRVLLIGGGYIGLELAASARSRGCAVVVWEAQERLLQRSLDPVMAELLAGRHRSHGVELLCGVQLERLEHKATGIVASATDGRRVEVDVVIIGVGAVPNDELAQAAGIGCSNGVVVDESCRTSVPNIYAIGDVANQPSAFYGHRIRLESWENAEHQGQAVAHALLGQPAHAMNVPWFWTDQYKDNWQMLGLPGLAERVLLRGDPESGQCIGLGLRDERVVSAVMLNMARARRPLKKLMEGRVVVDAGRLVDMSIPLEKVA